MVWKGKTTERTKELLAVKWGEVGAGGIYMIYRGMHRSPVDPDTVRVVRQQTVRQQGGSSKPRKHRRMK